MLLAGLGLPAWSAVIRVPQDYPTIVDAVGWANPGDEIVIEAGTYDESDMVHVWAPMTLRATNGLVTVRCPSSKDAVAEVAPGRFNLGIGSGSQPIVELWNGGKFRKPATRVREMALFLRKAFAGERVVFEGETFRVDGFRMAKPPSEPIPIHIAALREGMLRVAGEVGDGAIINWLSAEDVKKSVAVVREAAKAAGRNPDDVEITARLMVCIDPLTPEVAMLQRRHLNAYLNVPVYKEFHRWLGREPLLSAMWTAWDSGDRKAALAAVPDVVVQDLFVAGTAEERNAHVQRYLEAGVDTAFLQFISFDPDPAVRRERVLQAMREMSPKAAGM